MAPAAEHGAGRSGGRRSAPEIAMIWAQARGGVIGADGGMPWHLPEDLQHFKRTTAGAPVIMGRRTWESFPARFRPLPGRTSIVISRSEGFTPAGGLLARSLEEALAQAREDLAAAEDAGAGTIWIIGGGSLYREAMPQAQRLVVTEIDLEADGDTLAPPIPADFQLVAADPGEGWHRSRTGLDHRFLTYRR